MFSKDLIYIDINFFNQKDLFTTMANELLKKGYVKPDYVHALIEREEKYPTGIQTGSINIAIPHVDSNYIKKPGIAFVRPLEPIKFKEMCTDNELNVEIIFMLLINDKNKQVPVLSALMKKISSKAYLKSLKNEKDINLLLDKLNNIIGGL